MIHAKVGKVEKAEKAEKGKVEAKVKLEAKVKVETRSVKQKAVLPRHLIIRFANRVIEKG